jgi:hypothetical protein
MALLFGLCFVAMFIAGCKGLCESSVVFRKIGEVFRGLYALTMIVWYVVEWVKTDWYTALWVVWLMGIPWVVCGFIWDVLVPDKKISIKVETPKNDG